MANAVEDSGETHINTSLRSLKDKAGMNRCAIAWETNMSVWKVFIHPMYSIDLGSDSSRE